jgi:signal transduction histidine kinase
MSKFSRSISKVLSLDIMLLAVPLFVLSLGAFYVQSRYLIRQQAIQRTNSILKTTIQRVRNYMNTIETSTNANAWLLEEHFTPDSLESVSKRMVRFNPNILSCSVSTVPNTFPQYGRYFSIYTVNEVDTIVSVRETNYAYYDKDWYRVPLMKGRASWVEPFSEHTEGTINHNEAVATYSRPLRSEEGHVVGVLSADFSFSQLAKAVLSTSQSYSDAYFMLIGGDGRYFVHPDSTQLFRKTIFTDADPTKNADIITLGYQMIEGKIGYMHVDLHGEICHVCYHPVPGTDWSLAMVCPDKEILSGFDRLGYVIIALIIIGLLAIMWLSNVVVKQTIHPINQLLGITQRIASGDYSEVIPRSRQNDDVGHLQNAFATMQQALHDRMGSIRQTAEEIRKRNEQRAHDMDLAEEAVRKKTLFIQNLSHQIRTPLNIIVGFANVLYDSIVSRCKKDAATGSFEEENLNDMMGMMKYNAMHLKRMILMLFDSSSTTGADELMGNRHDEVSCNDVARESIDYTHGHFQRVNVNFESELSDGVCILTNRLYLMRSIRELLYNAAKFSDHEHIRLHVSETDTTIRFTVEDTGPGLPDNSDELIYKPFSKIDDLSEGLGLGLSLTKRHALTLGGDLIYDKDYQDGCRFILEMPK